MNASTESTNRGSNFRTRLYWAWQAWRLRNAATAEAAGSAGVFTNFAAIEHRGHADSLCELAEALSGGTSGLVGESAAQVRARLQRDLGSRACVAVLNADRHVAGGYAWGRVDPGAEAVASLRRLPSLVAVAERDWGTVAAAIGDRTTLVLHDIGLDSRYRYGFSPLKQLLMPLFDLGVTHAARRALWWAPRTSPLYGLSLAFGARAVGADDGIAFFVHNDVAMIARILHALSAGEISTLLARIGPPRAAPARITTLPAHVAARVAAERGARMSESSSVSGPAAARFVDHAAALVAADYPGMSAQAAANDEDHIADAAASPLATYLPGAVTVSDAPHRRLVDDHPPLQALPQRLSALFPRRAV